MAEVTADAYTLLQKHIVDNWTNIELYDDADNEIISLSTDDSRVSWTHATKQMQVGYDRMGNPMTETVPDTQTLQLEVVITGSDSDIDLDTTFAKIELSAVTGQDFENPGETVVSSETFTAFTISQEGDELTITHNIEVPQVV